jgi:hypothetical protein
MIAIHVALGVATTALFAVAAALGAWRWWRGQPSPSFWRVLRTAQAALLLETLNGGLLLALGREAGDDLHLLYGLLPLGVSFAAEQLRVSAAETVLAARGHQSAQEVGALPELEQRAVVIAVVRREMGVMTVAAAIAAALSVRAAFTA